MLAPPPLDVETPNIPSLAPPPATILREPDSHAAHADHKNLRKRDRAIRGIVHCIRFTFEWLSLITLLAVMTALPLVQLISFGYLLDTAGRLASGATIGNALRWRREAGKLGLAALALFLFSLPIRLVIHWATAAEIVSPGTPQAETLRVVAGLMAILGTIYLAWSWARGGRVKDYLWPAPIRFLRNFWRPSLWLDASGRFIDMLRSMELPRLLWLGTRGAVATLVWLLPGIVIIAANRNGESGLAGLVGALALLCLGGALMYLPMLQANFAAENRIRAMFEVSRVRADFCRAPWAWWAAMLLTLGLPIPLYLLKIEPPPPELLWLPTWFFIALMLPARVASGLALRRARHQPEPSGIWAAASRWCVRLLMLPTVGVYLLFVYLSQYVSWEGLQTWVQQHAVLVPVPFVGG